MIHSPAIHLSRTSIAAVPPLCPHQYPFPSPCLLPHSHSTLHTLIPFSPSPTAIPYSYTMPTAHSHMTLHCPSTGSNSKSLPLLSTNPWPQKSPALRVLLHPPHPYAVFETSSYPNTMSTGHSYMNPPSLASHSKLFNLLSPNPWPEISQTSVLMYPPHPHAVFKTSSAPNTMSIDHSHMKQPSPLTHSTGHLASDSELAQPSCHQTLDLKNPCTKLPRLKLHQSLKDPLLHEFCACVNDGWGKGCREGRAPPTWHPEIDRRSVETFEWSSANLGGELCRELFLRFALLCFASLRFVLGVVGIHAPPLGTMPYMYALLKL